MDNLINKRKNIVTIFFTEFIRIRGVFNWSAISFVGFMLGISTLALSDYIIPFVIFFISTFCILSFTFLINNYYDIESDKKNPKKIHFNAMASGKISKKVGVIANVLFVVVPLIVTSLFKIEVFLFCILFIFWMWIYSSPPLRLKGRPGIDIIWHFFAFVIIVLWGSLIAGKIELINWLVAISIGMSSCIAQVSNHINDYKFDKESGTKTYAVFSGIDSAKTTLKIIMILSLIFIIPLILLYSLKYSYTIAILIIGALLSVFVLKSNKELIVSPLYYYPAIFGVAVYGSCIVYHLLSILGEKMLELPFLIC